MRKIIVLFLIFIIKFAFSAENEIIIDSLRIDNHEIILYDLKFSKPDSCGDARLSSQLYIYLNAEVINVFSPDLIQVILYERPDGTVLIKPKKILVNLAGVSLNDFNLIAEKLLNNLILNKKVELLTTQDAFEDKNKISAVIQINKIDINYTLLKNGLGSFKIYNPYELDFWSTCKYKEACNNN